ncbi:hypothetical protein FRZ61_37210 [Hypericibacter adhaerens]|uniref:DUF3592 domain-containing protein n=1 Tax=Hypericibacter adhaerens TaxID=2602016 RepID=A0A5J6N1B7_9PROT|nr:DUF3592 domain-containing protein [Hypericibacter adhaerens]QEX23782.1 hypothetical protein FRZ61_37210 [Hypericibacter adhaerens]
MKLTIGDKTKDNPTTADIEQAVEAARRGQDDDIVELEAGEDEYLEALHEGDGRFSLGHGDKTGRFHTEEPIETARVKSVLGKYASGDPAWRRECRLLPDAKSPGGRKRIGSEPPVWAIVLVAVAFFALPILSILPDSWTEGWLSGIGPAWIVAGPIVVLLVAIVAHKLLQVRRAAAWPQAPGRITKSEVAARHKSHGDRPSEVVNEPAIEYEFTANGLKYTGTRIGIGEDSGGANTEAMLARYPVGGTVMVYYDPADPGNCVLERELPKGVSKGCLGLLAGLAVVAYGVWRFGGPVLTTLEGRMGEDRSHIFLIAGGAGLFLLLLFFGARKSAKQGNAWPSVSGRVVQSGTESYQERIDRRTVTRYAPVVEYAYLVNGREYRSRQIRLPKVQIGRSQAGAAKIAARYPEGKEVEVHYDPANPGEAALERSSGAAWFLLVLALIGFGVAVYASGVVG